MYQRPASLVVDILQHSPTMRRVEDFTRHKNALTFSGWWLTYPSEKYESQLG